MTNKTDDQDLRDQLAQMDANWKRALADYQNLQKRTLQQQANAAKLANLNIIQKLLPIMDHLLLAANHLNDPGLDLVVKQLQEVFDSEDVKQIDAIDQLFDPQTMEAIEQVDGKMNQVMEIVSQGYTIDNQLIRPTKVKVGKGE